MKKAVLFILFILGFLFISCTANEKVYTITYNVDPTQGTTIERNYKENDVLETIDLGTEAKEDSMIEGWYFDATYQEKISLPFTVTQNISLFAKWVPLHKVTFMVEESIYQTTKVMDEKFLKEIEKPTKPGATFVGWYIDASFQTPYDFESKVLGSFTLYAKFDIELFTVRFMDHTTLLKEKSVLYNTLVSEIKAPEKESYIFKGWSLHPDTYEPYSFTTPITKDIVLYAFYEKEPEQTYELTLWIDTIASTYDVAAGSTIEELNLPNKKGYVLQWFTDEEKTIPYDATTKITKDLTLYGKYQILSYKIDFKEDSLLLDSKKVEYNATLPAIPDPKKKGHTFKGWSLHPDTFEFFDLNTPITEDITLYAFYEINSYTVTYYDDTSLLATQRVEYNQLLNPIAPPEKEGYSFVGWSTSKTLYIPLNLTYPITEDVELYAFYEEIIIRVTFWNDSLVSTKQIGYNECVDMPSASEKEGYTFKGWSYKENLYDPFDFETKLKEDITLYAYYEINSYTVTFLIEDTEYRRISVKYNQTVSLPENPTTEGYIFKGWSTDPTTYIEFDMHTKIKKDVTLYAFFAEEIVVIFTIDGNQTKESVALGGKVKEPSEPSKEGYQFIGWFYNDELFDFNTIIEESIELVAKFKEADLEILSYAGYSEGLYIEAKPVASASLSDYQVSYRIKNTSTWQACDRELIRLENNTIRCDIVGLQAKEYEVKLAVFDKSVVLSISVSAYDRSGYAHFKYSNGIGAYNNDGTLKSNAIVVYVTNENKNTIQVGNYTGLVSILQNQKSIGKPLDIRIIGKISTNQYKSKSNAPRLLDNSNSSKDFFDNELETKYGENLVGLTVQYMDKKEEKSYKYETTKNGLQLKSTGKSSYKETSYNRSEYPEVTGKKVYDDDSYFNMLDIEASSNITLEGIGTSAEFFQWGLTWKKCNSIEVRNISFTDYPEDACSFEAGGNSDVNTYGNYWIHHNTFNRGKNNWDISGERDKYAGDGGIDVKYIHSVTLSYNKFKNCKKTGLVGGDNKNYTKNITFHHNYYYKVESRLPLGRQANMHIYNNYYENCTTCQDIRANAFVFSEANYFKNCDNPQKVTTDETYKNTIIKSYNDYYEGGGKSQATKVTSRTESLSGNCKPDGSTDYTNFDTNSTLFYYTGNASDVTILHKNTDVPEFCKTYSGVLKNGNTQPNPTPTPDPEPQPPVEDWTNQLTEDFSSTKPIQQIAVGDLLPKGISFCTDAADASQNYVTIEGGSLHIQDTSGFTTWGYYMFDSIKPQTGKVKISVDFIPPTASTKWTILQFIDGENNILIRTDGNKKLGYTINGEKNGTDFVVHPIDSNPIVPNQKYTVELIVDYQRREASISINGGTSVVLQGYSCTNTINGLGFMTAGKATDRSYTIDNIIVDWFN